MSDIDNIWDFGAMERDRERKIKERRDKYARFAMDFLGQSEDVVANWPIQRNDGPPRCGKVDCNQAIDDNASDAGIRRHLYIAHREEVGVEESGEWGENQALGSGSVPDSDDSDSSPSD